jgi:hypothetical protein
VSRTAAPAPPASARPESHPSGPSARSALSSPATNGKRNKVASTIIGSDASKSVCLFSLARGDIPCRAVQGDAGSRREHLTGREEEDGGHAAVRAT